MYGLQRKAQDGPGGGAGGSVLWASAEDTEEDGAQEVQYSGFQRKAQERTRTDPEAAQEVRYYCLHKAYEREAF